MMTMRFFLGLFLTTVLFSQSLTLTGPALTKPGTPTEIRLQQSGATANGPTAWQWTLAAPNATVTSPSTPVANKQVACSTDFLLCVLYGINLDVIPDGQIASKSVTLPPGLHSISLTGVIAGDKNGQAMPVTTGPALQIRATRTDVDGSGAVDVLDVQAIVGQVTAGTCVDDINGDGKCDLIDVVAVVLAALGTFLF